VTSLLLLVIGLLIWYRLRTGPEEDPGVYLRPAPPPMPGTGVQEPGKQAG
jgi:hypothetical protein